MRARRHSLHAAIVHFPIALFPAHFAFYLLGREFGSVAVVVSGFWVLVAGVAIGWVAVIAVVGQTFELLKEASDSVFEKLVWHGLVNVSVLMAFTVLAFIEASEYPEIDHGVLSLGFEVVAIVTMFAGNYLGGIITRSRMQ